ncbi:MAG: hypothetical protein M1836_003098 [Candelina mexicana]|nr:MAG: hypothetical protein M1836_003098 [Candelina mexicana]
MSTSRPKTPPPGPAQSNLARSPFTPEQIRKIETSRLKAKALREQHDEAARKANPTPSLNRTPSGFSTTSSIQKRPHSSISTSNTPSTLRDGRSATPAGAANDGGFKRPRADGDIQAAQKFTKYVEYDFSKMVDTKGGFLTAEDDPHNKALHAPGNGEEKPAHMTLAEWERHQLLRKLREQKSGPFEPVLSVLKKEESKKCRECGGLEIDWKWDEVFRCAVCERCKEKYPDKYSLLTKTEAREDYLLTDPELKDTDLLPHLSRPNPHKASFHNMMLYLRYQVEAFAFSPQKWSSPENLDAEFAKREVEKRRRKDDKFQKGLKDLKKRTRFEAHRRNIAAGGKAGGEFGDKIGTGKHRHEWGRTVENEEGVGVKTCVECGMEVEELEF